MDNKLKGTNFERRIQHEFEYYGGLIVRCAASKPSDLVWLFEGIPFLIECKDVNRLMLQGTLDKLLDLCKQGKTYGILVWQDSQYRVFHYLIRWDKHETSQFDKTADLIFEMKRIVRSH